MKDVGYHRRENQKPEYQSDEHYHGENQEYLSGEHYHGENQKPEYQSDEHYRGENQEYQSGEHYHGESEKYQSEESSIGPTDTEYDDSGKVFYITGRGDSHSDSDGDGMTVAEARAYVRKRVAHRKLAAAPLAKRVARNARTLLHGLTVWLTLMSSNLVKEAAGPVYDAWAVMQPRHYDPSECQRADLLELFAGEARISQGFAKRKMKVLQPRDLRWGHTYVIVMSKLTSWSRSLCRNHGSSGLHLHARNGAVSPTSTTHRRNGDGGGVVRWFSSSWLTRSSTYNESSVGRS